MKIILTFLCLMTCSLQAQTVDTARTFPIDYCKEPGMLVPTFEDSCLIDELAFDGPVTKAYMFKYSELNFMITLKFEQFDMVYTFCDGYLDDIFEIGPTHFKKYSLE
jgi:hypothetical protein